MKGQDQIGLRDTLLSRDYKFNKEIFNTCISMQHYLLSLVVAQRDALEIAIHNCLGSEGGSCKRKMKAAASMRSEMFNVLNDTCACCQRKQESPTSLGHYSPGFPMIAGIVAIKSFYGCLNEIMHVIEILGAGFKALKMLTTFASPAIRWREETRKIGE